MRIVLAAGLIVSAVTLAGCGGGGPQIDPDAKPVAGRWNATSPRQRGWRAQCRCRARAGWARIRRTRRKPRPTSRSPTPRRAASIPGTCTGDSAAPTWASSARPTPIRSLKVGGDGKAHAEADLQIPMPVQGQYFINVHASAQNMATIVACGNLAPPAP